MIEKISVGIDIVDIKRFKKLNYEENTRFFKRILSKSEIEYCRKFKNSSFIIFQNEFLFNEKCFSK